MALPAFRRRGWVGSQAYQGTGVRLRRNLLPVERRRQVIKVIPCNPTGPKLVAFRARPVATAVTVNALRLPFSSVVPVDVGLACHRLLPLMPDTLRHTKGQYVPVSWKLELP
ncbi:MAG: hypothetical protein PsegKO_17830 [Pseudohongiellaceae bacterium]